MGLLLQTGNYQTTLIIQGNSLTSTNLVNFITNNYSAPGFVLETNQTQVKVKPPENFPLGLAFVELHNKYGSVRAKETFTFIQHPVINSINKHKVCPNDPISISGLGLQYINSIYVGNFSVAFDLINDCLSFTTPVFNLIDKLETNIKLYGIGGSINYDLTIYPSPKRIFNQLILANKFKQNAEEIETKDGELRLPDFSNIIFTSGTIKSFSNIETNTIYYLIAKSNLTIHPSSDIESRQESIKLKPGQSITLIGLNGKVSIL